MKKKSIFAPTEAEIRREAYLLWLAGGCESGCELDHWLAAKESLNRRSRRSKSEGSRAVPAISVDTLHFPLNAKVNRPLIRTQKS